MKPIHARNWFTAFINALLCKCKLVKMTIDLYNESPIEPPDGYSGAWVVFWPNGMVKSIFNFKNGKQHGERTCVWDNGLLCQIGQCENGMPTGEWVEYNNRGLLSSKYQCNGKGINGIKTTFYHDGSVMEEKEHVDGVANGRVTYYDQGGEILLTGIIKDGNPFSGWFSEGRIKKNGETIGPGPWEIESVNVQYENGIIVTEVKS